MFDWGHYLTLAKNQIATAATASGDVEAYYRCAVSRAYYSAFHKAKIYVKANGAVQQKYSEGSHQEVIDELFKSNAWLSNKLIMLKRYRRKSDYEEDVEVNDRMAVASITMAEKIIADLK